VDICGQFFSKKSSIFIEHSGEFGIITIAIEMADLEVQRPTKSPEGHVKLVYMCWFVVFNHKTSI